MELRRRFRGEPDTTSDGRPRRTVAGLLDATAAARHERQRRAPVSTHWDLGAIPPRTRDDHGLTSHFAERARRSRSYFRRSRREGSTRFLSLRGRGSHRVRARSRNHQPLEIRESRPSRLSSCRSPGLGLAG
jgi:hypothetical protein